MKQHWLKYFLLLAALEGVLAFILLFAPRSMERNAWLLGYSAVRIGLGAAVLLALLPLAVLTTLAFTRPHWNEALCRRLDSTLQPKNLLPWVVTLVFGIGVGMLTLVVFATRLAPYLGILVAFYERAFPILLWSLAVALQTLALLWVAYPQFLRRRSFYVPSVIVNVLLALTILLMTGFYWCIMVFNLDIFSAIPYWFWMKTHNPFGLWDLLFPLTAVIAFFVIRTILRHPQRAWRNLLLLIALGYLVQVSFGFMWEGKMFESIRQRFVRVGHVQYALHASDKPEFWHALTDFETQYGQDVFLGTKPPGVLMFYMITQKVSALVIPADNFDQRVYSLTMFSAVVFPLVSVLVLVFIILISRAYLPPEDALLPGIFYIFCPNIVLMHMELDQIFFPLLFMVGAWLGLRTIRSQAWGWAFAAGLFYYIAVYFTFSLIPLLPFIGVWIAADFLIHRRQRNIWKTVRLLAALGLGAAVGFMILRLTLNYDILLRYGAALARHRAHKEFQSGIQQILNALLLNNIEFMIWSGIVIYLLAAVRMVKSGLAWLRRQMGDLDALTAASLATYGALNLFGQTRGEVGRLWLFILPLFTLFAAIEARSLFRWRRAGIIFVIVLQLMTTLLMLKYQDFIFI